MGEENDKSPFNAAAAIRHPISLGAAAVIAITLIFKAFLEMGIFPQLSGEQAFELLNRTLTYIFIFAAVVLMAVMVLSYLKNSKTGVDQQGDQSAPHSSAAGIEPIHSEPELPPVENDPPLSEPSPPQPSAGSHVDTGGGAYIEGDVNTDGGDFIGRDQINE
jgi:hypothetical protein